MRATGQKLAVAGDHTVGAIVAALQAAGLNHVAIAVARLINVVDPRMPATPETTGADRGQASDLHHQRRRFLLSHFITKAEKTGRTKAEVDEILRTWSEAGRVGAGSRSLDERWAERSLDAKITHREDH